jgi:predicted HicB family RNase H-like nuclease
MTPPGGARLLVHHRGYDGEALREAETGLYRGRVTGLRDVLTFQGASAAAATEAFRATVDDYLAWCAEGGKAPEVPGPAPGPG